MSSGMPALIGGGSSASLAAPQPSTAHTQVNRSGTTLRPRPAKR
jgi:hypothetical protein